KPSSARSSVTMSASVRVRMRRPSCTSYQLGSITTTRFTRTRHSDIVHPVSSSQLTEARDRVRSFGGYNIGSPESAAPHLSKTCPAYNSTPGTLTCARDLIRGPRAALDHPKSTLQPNLRTPLRCL